MHAVYYMLCITALSAGIIVLLYTFENISQLVCISDKTFMVKACMVFVVRRSHILLKINDKEVI